MVRKRMEKKKKKRIEMKTEIEVDKEDSLVAQLAKNPLAMWETWV